MFVTSHVLAGATIGSLLGRHPVGAFAVGVISHFAMDACPHWGVMAVGPEADAQFLRVARCDGCCGLAAMAGAGLLAARGSRTATLAAMAGAALPDMDKPCVHFFGFNPFPRRFREFHGQIQRESPHRFRQELVIAVGLGAGAALSLRRRP